jgi:hypothetical protein
MAQPKHLPDSSQFRPKELISIAPSRLRRRKPDRSNQSAYCTDRASPLSSLLYIRRPQDYNLMNQGRRAKRDHQS